MPRSMLSLSSSVSSRAVRRATKLLAASLAVAIALPVSQPAFAQMMRGPNINMGVRMTPNVAPRVNPNIAPRVSGQGNFATKGNVGPRTNATVGSRGGGQFGGQSTSSGGGPRTNVGSGNLASGGARNTPAAARPGGSRTTAGPGPITGPAGPIIPTLRYPAYPGYWGGPQGGGGTPVASGPTTGPSGNRPQQAQATPNARVQPNEVVIEIQGQPTEAQVAEIARRHRLTRLESQSFPLVGSTFYRWRITDGRPVQSVLDALAADGTIGSAQRNYRYALQSTPSAGGDPAQYAVAKLRLPEAHAIWCRSSVTVAVIDSAIDQNHPELAGVIVGSFDALNSKEGPHAHGTGIAGAIASHARLMGSAPAARILAIRAFGATRSGAESTSFAILKSLSFAVEQKAQIINMSFAGPQDSLIGRALGAIAQKNIVLIAAAGNAGPKSPPLYPAADPNVIGVSATDSSDQIFAASNQGSHVSVAAPGVDVLLPAPDNKYQMTSGTSFSAAYVSGVAALMLARNPAMTPRALRGTLMATARDLGAPGPDDQFGAGIADAYAAVQASAAPVTASSGETRSVTLPPMSAAPSPMTPASAESNSTPSR